MGLSSVWEHCLNIVGQKNNFFDCIDMLMSEFFFEKYKIYYFDAFSSEKYFEKVIITTIFNILMLKILF